MTGPIGPAPDGYWVGAVPATLEWTYFAAGGVVLRDGSNSGPLGAVGSELTFELLRYHGFPSGFYARQRGDAEVRVGPWAMAATRAGGGLVEGGLKLHFGGIHHASFGTWDLRAGAGYTGYDDGRAPHFTATFAYGVRSVLARYPKDRIQWSDRSRSPELFAEASVARLFFTYRRSLDDAVGSSEIVLGVELSPTFLLPPYSLSRFIGSQPR